jgi:hypothetical protein
MSDIHIANKNFQIRFPRICCYPRSGAFFRFFSRGSVVPQQWWKSPLDERLQLVIAHNSPASLSSGTFSESPFMVNFEHSQSHLGSVEYISCDLQASRSESYFISGCIFFTISFACRTTTLSNVFKIISGHCCYKLFVKFS